MYKNHTFACIILAGFKRTDKIIINFGYYENPPPSGTVMLWRGSARKACVVYSHSHLVDVVKIKIIICR